MPPTTALPLRRIITTANSALARAVPSSPTSSGGKTYLFALYQGYRYPNSEMYRRPVPSPDLRNGIVTIGGTTYDLAAIDPRHIGINPVVQQMWNKYEPAGKSPAAPTSQGQLATASTSTNSQAP